LKKVNSCWPCVGSSVGSKSIVMRRAPPLAPGPLLRDHEVGERMPQPSQHQRGDGILEARQRGLRGQRRAGERIAIQQQLVHRIVGQAGGIVAIGVATDEPEDALLHQLEELVLDLAGLPRIPQAAGDGGGHPEPPIDGLEQHPPAVRTGMLGVEPRYDKLVELERELRYTGCSHRASS
jgi:hypothetical protein